MKAASFVFLAVVAAAQDRTAGGTANITGIVVDSVSHQPLKKANVTLIPIQTAGPGVLPPTPTTTDGSGAFTFNNLKPGQYRLSATRSDYPGEKRATAIASENSDPLTVELIAGAAISGRILDEDGDPMDVCSLDLHSTVPGQLLTGGLRGQHAIVLRGEYRLFGILPGKYKLSAQCNNAVFQPRPFSAGPDPPPSRAYPVQYYPAAPDASSAEVLELAPASERVGVDFKMRTAAVTQVRVSVRGAPANDRNINVQLIGVDASRPATMRPLPDSSATFQFLQVFPGSYLLSAISRGPGGVLGAMQRIDVGDRPVEAAIEMRFGADVAGTVEVASGAGSDKVRLPEINIQSVPEYAAFETAGSIPGINAQVKQDGSFALNSVFPGRWRVRVSGGGAFAKSLWLGPVEVAGYVLDLSSGGPSALRIVVSGNMGSIRGTAPPGEVFELSGRDEPALYSEIATADENGQISIDNVAPGQYRLTPVNDEKDAGQELTVREGETTSVELGN